MRLRSSIRYSDHHGLDSVPSASNKKIGAILTEEGLIENSDVGAILTRQSQNAELFGEAAIGLGKISREALDYALAKQVDSAVLPQGDDSVDPALVCAFDLNDPYAAKIRQIRNKITDQLSAKGELDHRFCAIVGFDCPEETAILAANLAILIARFGTTTVAVDANYGAPMFDGLFRVPNRTGLSTIRGETPAGEVAQKSAIANLSVITAGPQPATSTAAMEREAIVAKLESWDHVQTQFVVSLFVENEQAVSSCAQSLMGFDAVVLLARKHETAIADLRQMIDLLDERKVKIAGIVIV